MVAQISKKQAELIKAATINRILDKITGACLGYAVKSNTTSDYYRVTTSKVAGTWHYFCTCKAGQNAFRNCKDGKCCHVKAVLEVVAAKKAMQREQEAAPAASYDVVAEAAAVVEAAENAALDAAYEARGKEMSRAKTRPREIGCDRCFERGYWQRDENGHYLCPECRAELAASARAASRAKQHATCEYCGRNHASSECYL